MFIFDRDKQTLYCFSTLCRKIYNFNDATTLLFLPFAPFENFPHEIRDKDTYKHSLYSLIDEMQIWDEREWKKVSGLKCITWSEAVVTNIEMMCMHSSYTNRMERNKKYLFTFLARTHTHTLDRSRFKRDDKWWHIKSEFFHSVSSVFWSRFEITSHQSDIYHYCFVWQNAHTHCQCHTIRFLSSRGKKKSLKQQRAGRKKNW